jgi:hypothetical protein
MRKFVTSVLVSAALCVPTAAMADHTNIPADLYMEEYETMEDCEDALAQVRNMERKSGEYEGRERGQYNKAFNARYECEETDWGTYMIEDANMM